MAQVPELGLKGGADVAWGCFSAQGDVGLIFNVQALQPIGQLKLNATPQLIQGQESIPTTGDDRGSMFHQPLVPEEELIGVAPRSLRSRSRALRWVMTWL